MSKDTAKKVTIGAIVAGIVGFIAGILSAPKSGKETRADIKEGVGDAAETIEKEFNATYKELVQTIKDAKNLGKTLSGPTMKKFTDALEIAIAAKKKAFEVLKTAKTEEFEAVTKELSKAITGLKTFLKK